MMNYPSIKTLSRITSDRAPELRRLIDGTTEDPDGYESVQRWIAQCYHTPHHEEQVMEAANEILEGHGVEAMRCNGDHGYYHGEIHAVYVNRGDTYDSTLIYESETGRFIVSSVGDYVESVERRRGDCRFM